MPLVRIFAGPFESKIFVDGLVAMLSKCELFQVERIDDVSALDDMLASTERSVIIIEQRADDDIDSFRPRSSNVSVILLSREGCEAVVLLKALDQSRFCDLVRSAASGTCPEILEVRASEVARLTPLLATHQRSFDLGPVETWLDLMLGRALSAALPEGEEAKLQSWGPAIADTLERLLKGRRFDDRVHHELDDLTEAIFQTGEAAPAWLARAVDALSLTNLEARILCLVASPDFDDSYGRAFGILQDNLARTRPTFSCLARVIEPGMLGCKLRSDLADGNLHAHYCLLRPIDDGKPAAGEVDRFRLASELLSFILGDRPRRGSGVALHERKRIASGSSSPFANAIAQLQNANVQRPILLLPNDQESAGQLIDGAVEAGMPVLTGQLSGKDAGGENLSHLVRRWAGLAQLYGALLLIEGLQDLTPRRRSELALDDLAGRCPILALAGGTLIGGEVHRVRQLDRSTIGADEQARIWQNVAAARGLELCDAAAARLASTLNLGTDQIVACACLAEGDRQSGSAEERIRVAARTILRKISPPMIRHIEPTFTWDDMVLPELILDELRTIPEHIRLAPTVIEHWGFGDRVPSGRAVAMTFCTEIEFTLPKGYLDNDGVLHKEGVMRLATAADEILPLKDPRVAQNPAYIAIIVLSRVITKLGSLSDINTKIVEGLFAADLNYLQSLYERLNGEDEGNAEGRVPAANGHAREGFGVMGEA